MKDLKTHLMYVANEANRQRVDALIQSMKDNAANGEYGIKVDITNKDLAIYMSAEYKLELDFLDPDPESGKPVIILRWRPPTY